MTEPTKEQKGIWLNVFYEWYKDCFSIDGDMAEQVKTQMFADMKYAYIAAKKSDFEEIKTLREQLTEAVELLRYVQHPKNTDEWVDCGKEVDRFLEKQDKENKDEK